MNKNKLFQWSIVAALAGFIFGFDTVVISGANLPIKNLWHTSPLFHGFFIMSMALWGTLVGSIFGGIPTEIFGRKKVLFWVGILFAISALGSAFAPNPYIFSFFSSPLKRVGVRLTKESLSANEFMRGLFL